MIDWIGGGYPVVAEIIPGPGQYRTRAGELVVVESRRGRWADGRYSDGTRESWHRSGRIFPNLASSNDIVAVDA
ncbi:MAG: hypothetical protein EOM92_20720 [Gammaproteobacteria bacterium]|nr:hypothetical protein [Gammaproteobacteria bacterium]